MQGVKSEGMITNGGMPQASKVEALLGVLGIRYIYPKYFSYKVLVNIDFWV